MPLSNYEYGLLITLWAGRDCARFIARAKDSKTINTCLLIKTWCKVHP